MSNRAIIRRETRPKFGSSSASGGAPRGGSGEPRDIPRRPAPAPTTPLSSAPQGTTGHREGPLAIPR